MPSITVTEGDYNISYEIHKHEDAMRIFIAKCRDYSDKSTKEKPSFTKKGRMFINYFGTTDEGKPWKLQLQCAMNYERYAFVQNELSV